MIMTIISISLLVTQLGVHVVLFVKDTIKNHTLTIYDCFGRYGLLSEMLTKTRKLHVSERLIAIINTKNIEEQASERNSNVANHTHCLTSYSLRLRLIKFIGCHMFY